MIGSRNFHCRFNPRTSDYRTNICTLFFFNDTATTEIYTLSLHDALPICTAPRDDPASARWCARGAFSPRAHRSEEHTSELQSRPHLVCRPLLEKKKSASLRLCKTHPA